MPTARRSADLSLTEWVVLGVVGEGPTHGFAIARQLRSDSDLGRVITVQRPLVYRALDRLTAAGMIEAAQVEPGDAGPNRTIHRTTRRGRAALARWLDRPVDHVRDLRVEFLAKLRLNERRSRSAARLVQAQRAALDTTLTRLARTQGDDVVDRWRHHNAAAVDAFLSELDLEGAG